MSKVWRLAYPRPPISLAYLDLIVRQNYRSNLIGQLNERTPLFDYLLDD